MTQVRNSQIAGAAVNVRDLGAKGDNATDDAAAIQAAIDAANVGTPVPREVVLPAGYYVIRSSLALSYPKWRLRGVGGYAVLMVTGNVDGLTITGPGGALDSIHVYRASGTGKAVAYSAPESKFTRLRISGHHTTGFEMDGTTPVGAARGAHMTTLLNSYISGCDIGLDDLGRSQATELISTCIIANGTGLRWASARLNVFGGQIEQNTVAEILLGTDSTRYSGTMGGAKASFYGVHFEHDNVSGTNPTGPMITVGPSGAASNTSIQLVGCDFFGNSSLRTAVAFQGGGGQVLGSVYTGFGVGAPPTITANAYSKGITFNGGDYTTLDASITHKSINASSSGILDFEEDSAANTVASFRHVAGSGGKLAGISSLSSAGGSIAVAGLLSMSSGNLVQTSATDAGLGVKGNRNAGSTTSDVVLQSAATRTAGGIVDAYNNATKVAQINWSGGLVPGQLNAGGAAASATIYSGTGAPSNSYGVDGDFYFRFDTPGSANQRLYVRSAGSWVGIL